MSSLESKVGGVIEGRGGVWNAGRAGPDHEPRLLGGANAVFLHQMLDLW